MKSKILWMPFLVLCLTACEFLFPTTIADDALLTIHSVNALDDVQIGDQIQFSAKIDGKNTTSVVWSASPTGYASVSQSGILKPYANGEISLKCVSTVNYKVFNSIDIVIGSGISINVESIEIRSEVMTPLVIGVPRNLSYYSVPEVHTNTIAWSSSSEDIATVSSTGVVLPISEGSVTINVAAVESAKTDSVIFTVVSPGITPLSLSIDSLYSNTIEVGRTIDPLEITTDPSNAEKSVLWSSSNATYVSVSASGSIKGNNPGEARITATSFFDSTVSAYIDITVVPVGTTPTELTLSTSSGDTVLGLNSLTDLIVSSTPVGADISGVTWSLNNPTVGAVVNSETTPQFSANAVGSVIVTVTSSYDASVKGELALQVVEETGVELIGDASSTNLNTINWYDWLTSMDSIGDPKMLVVPVQVKNEVAWSPTMLAALNTAFFGKSADLDWESVSSFYQKSSYGQLNITGTVLSPLVLSKTKLELMAIRNTNASGDPNLVDHVDHVASEFYQSIDAKTLRDHDSDGDGLVDSVCFIYSNVDDSSNGFWAWVFWFKVNAEVPMNSRPWPEFTKDVSPTGKPGLQNHMWASYDFMNDGHLGTSGIDAHTYIHETGHILGLPDYYTNTNSSPSGGVIMQAYNVTDQDPFSKFALGWTKPYYVNGKADVTTININSFTESGDFILIKNDWEKKPLDEYILLELYTPTGLNKRDSDFALPGRGKGYSIPGVRMWHVNSALTIDIVDSFGSLQYVETRNSVYPYQLELIAATNRRSLSDGGKTWSTNEDLFTTGATFNPVGSVFFNNAKFYDGTNVGYKVQFDSVTLGGARITITKL